MVKSLSNRVPPRQFQIGGPRSQPKSTWLPGEFVRTGAEVGRGGQMTATTPTQRLKRPRES